MSGPFLCEVLSCRCARFVIPFRAGLSFLNNEYDLFTHNLLRANMEEISAC